MRACRSMCEKVRPRICFPVNVERHHHVNGTCIRKWNSHPCSAYLVLLPLWSTLGTKATQRERVSEARCTKNRLALAGCTEQGRRLAGTSQRKADASTIAERMYGGRLAPR